MALEVRNDMQITRFCMLSVACRMLTEAGRRFSSWRHLQSSG